MTTFLLIWLSTTGINSQKFTDKSAACMASLTAKLAGPYELYRLEPETCIGNITPSPPCDPTWLGGCVLMNPSPTSQRDRVEPCQSRISVSRVTCRRKQPDPVWEIEEAK